MLSTGDVDALYRARSAYLQRLVRLDTSASDEVIEDACQHAWTSVLAHREGVDGCGVFAWLARTAMREAWRLTARRDACRWPLESLGAGEPAVDAPAIVDRPAVTPSEVVELRDRLAQIGRLPTRQQRLLWLHGAGLSYGEMARHEGVTRRTVERQLLRGKRAVRAMDTGEPRTGG